MTSIHQNSEKFWEVLLSKIEEGRVIPVIGPAVTFIKVDGKIDLLEAHIARRLSDHLNIDVKSVGSKISLRDIVARAYKQDPHEDYHNEVFRILRRLGNLPTPEPLQALARITDFKLYVSLTFDDLLIRALDEIRGPIDADKQHIGYAPNLRQIDMLTSLQQSSEPTVYALFGKACSTAEYVISDEDLIEWITALQDPDNRPQHLFDALRSNHLLFIGCSLPDWLLRFFLRITREGRISAKRSSETMIDNAIPDQHHLIAFLDRFSPRTAFFDANPIEFIQQLEERWQRLKHNAMPGYSPDVSADLRPGGVFISYASGDSEAAIRLYEALTDRQIDTWFDSQRLNTGDRYDRVIERNIGLCGVFIVVLSRVTLKRLQYWRDEDQSHLDKKPYFLKEWELALARERLFVDTIAIYPIFINSIDLYDPLIPEGIRQLTCQSMPLGKIENTFLDRIKMSVREKRKKTGG
jgi:hypothetical protein